MAKSLWPNCVVFGQGPNANGHLPSKYPFCPIPFMLNFCALPDKSYLLLQSSDHGFCPQIEDNIMYFVFPLACLDHLYFMLRNTVFCHKHNVMPCTEPFLLFHSTSGHPCIPKIIIVFHVHLFCQNNIVILLQPSIHPLFGIGISM
jgi:hypothetical protein